MSALNDRCIQVTRAEWFEDEYAAGMTIEFERSVWLPRHPEENRYARDTGDILELWVEPWDGKSLLYAEVADSAGEPHRVWFHRDKVRVLTEEPIMGAVPEGAMF